MNCEKCNHAKGSGLLQKPVEIDGAECIHNIRKKLDKENKLIKLRLKLQERLGK